MADNKRVFVLWNLGWQHKFNRLKRGNSPFKYISCTNTNVLKNQITCHLCPRLYSLNIGCTDQPEPSTLQRVSLANSITAPSPVDFSHSWQP